MMFNSVVVHVAGEFVAVEGWTVVSFQNVRISESAKNRVHFVYYFRRCESLEWYDLWVASEVVDDDHNVFSVSNVGKVTTDLIPGTVGESNLYGFKSVLGCHCLAGKTVLHLFFCDSVFDVTVEFDVGVSICHWPFSVSQRVSHNI